MTVSIVVSDFITAQTGVNHGAKEAQGTAKAAVAVCEASEAPADNCVLAFFKIPVDANIISLRHASDDLGDNGTTNIGLYPGTIAAASLTHTDAIDEDCLATAIDAHTGAVAFTEIRYEVKGIETAGQKAWQLAGLSARPAYGEFWVCATVATAYTAAGTVALDIIYI